VRKSLLSALVGIGVAEGRIRLGETIGALGIDDRDPGLTETEKEATIRDLLMARSGIYHPAAYEAPDMKARRQQRGSHPPGSFWYYNNLGLQCARLHLSEAGRQEHPSGI
jgi:CubicO group peptidase (beta-lactamase class C family)